MDPRLASLFRPRSAEAFDAAALPTVASTAGMTSLIYDVVPVQDASTSQLRLVGELHGIDVPAGASCDEQRAAICGSRVVDVPDVPALLAFAVRHGLWLGQWTDSAKPSHSDLYLRVVDGIFGCGPFVRSVALFRSMGVARTPAENMRLLVRTQPALSLRLDDCRVGPC
jgi:hypothetical protein